MTLNRIDLKRMRSGGALIAMEFEFILRRYLPGPALHLFYILRKGFGSEGFVVTRNFNPITIYDLRKDANRVGVKPKLAKRNSRHGRVYEFVFNREDARSANEVLRFLRHRFREGDYEVRKGGRIVSIEDSLPGDTSDEMRDILDEEVGRLPHNYRKSYGNEFDITDDSCGQPTSVWKPENPENRFE